MSFKARNQNVECKKADMGTQGKDVKHRERYRNNEKYRHPPIFAVLQFEVLTTHIKFKLTGWKFTKLLRANL